ncbi:MAG: methyltransferase domain-containing protein [Chlamydiia bacterium]|nr:methyltransferase domain-containing protein [Chlamydiia bacterium]
MKASFKLFSSHLDLAKVWWEKVVTPESTVVDLTAGNGHDTAFLAGLGSKRLIAVDIQEAAIHSAKERVKGKVEWVLADHKEFPLSLDNESVNLAVYNLGWLPGSDKSVTTLTNSTLKSLENLLPKIAPGGLISLTCYPGHLEGEKEEGALLVRLQTLDPKLFSISYHTWQNRQKAPSLILIQKA